MTDKTYTATEFMVEFGNALAAFGAGKGPDPRGKWEHWQAHDPMHGWSLANGCPVNYYSHQKYRWAPGSLFAPHEKKRYITINGKVMVGGVLEIRAGVDYFFPGRNGGKYHTLSGFSGYSPSGWEFASVEQAQAVADELDKLMWGEVR